MFSDRMSLCIQPQQWSRSIDVQTVRANSNRCSSVGWYVLSSSLSLRVQISFVLASDGRTGSAKTSEKVLLLLSSRWPRHSSIQGIEQLVELSPGPRVSVSGACRQYWSTCTKLASFLLAAF